MNHYFVLPDSKILPIVGPVSYSTGDGLELTQRYGYDYSNAPQGLVYRKRNTALTASIQLTMNDKMCLDEGYISIFEYIDDVQDAVGKKVELFWNGRKTGSFVIVSAQVASTVDAVGVFGDVSISLALTEGFVRRETLQNKVSTLEKTPQ
jgi:hypothetical protein